MLLLLQLLIMPTVVASSSDQSVNLSTVVSNIQRPEHFEFVTASPEEQIIIRLPRGSSLIHSGVQANLQLYIDESGTVALYLPDTTLDHSLISLLDSIFQNSCFRPASYRNNFIAQLLPVRLRCIPGQRYARLILPVSHEQIIQDRELYRKNLELNGIQLPFISFFPSYFHTLRPSDSIIVYPFLLINLKLDTEGQPIDIQPIVGTVPSFEQQLLAASNWAKYRTAISRGEAVASDNLLLISLFSEVSYPSQPIQIEDTAAKADFFNSLRLQLVLDTSDLLSFPLPRRYSNGFANQAAAKGRFYGDIYVRILVDSLGRGRLFKLDNRPVAVHKLCEWIVDRERYYPAIGVNARPRPFLGTALFRFDGSTKVRIEYDWFK